MPWSLNARAAEAYTSLCEERIKQINAAELCVLRVRVGVAQRESS